MKPKHIAWSRRTFESLKDGGVWMAPNAGFIFIRKGAELCVMERMPWSEDIAAAYAAGSDVPMNKEQFIKHQEDNLELIISHFKAAGINVIR